jgi:hypothetical protein
MKRYPLEPLAEAMHLSPYQACEQLGATGRVGKDYRTRGVSELVADRLATKAGLSAYEVWPELRDDTICEVLHVEPDARSTILHRCTQCGRRQSGELVSEAPERMEALLVCAAGHKERLTVTVEAA